MTQGKDTEMGFIAWLIIGGLAGWLASMFMNKETGIIMNIIVGIIGAYIGAVILLWVVGKLKKS